MSIDSLFTVQTGNRNAGQSSGMPVNIAAGGSGLAFMELFLQQLQTAEELKKIKEAGQSLLNSDNPALATEEEAAEMVDVFSSLDEKLTQALSLNQDALDQQLSDADLEKLKEASDKVKDVLNALLLDDKNAGKPKLHMVQDLLGQVQALIEEQDPALINTNLTPAQMQQVQDEVNLILAGESSAKESAERLAQSGIGAAMVTLTPPQQRTSALFLAQSLSGGKNSNGLTAANDVSHTLSDITPAAGEGEAADVDFKNFLKHLAEAGGTVGNNADAAAAKNAGNIIPLKDAGLTSLATAADSSALQGWPFSLNGSLLSSLSSFGSFDEMGLSGVTQGQVTNPGQHTSLITQAQNATQPHPSTQMVSATIQKAVANGKPTNITLQMDPPELGRVEVRMALESDKSVKTKITVEKPETLAMLQRDVAHLERALQGSGLETDAGIEFELAGEDYAFGQNGSHDEHNSGQSGNGHNGDEGEEMETWETTMTWSVDPETGHTKYSILA